MPHLRFAAVAFAAALASPAFAADPVTGDWMLPSGAAKVRIAPCPADRAKMCGHVAWLKTPDVRDAKNPDPALRGRPVVGMMMIQDFKSAGPARWTEGKIYNPASGKTYGAKMGLNPNGTLKVEGCIAMICQSQTWRRAS